MTEPLPVERNRWIVGERGAVYYASLGSIRLLLQAMRQLRGQGPRLLYFNSFFNRPLTMLPLMLWRFGFWGRTSVLLAPRGEFGGGALSRRTARKRVWIAIVRALRLHRSIVWHATAEHEVEDIRRMWGADAQIIMRENDTLLPKVALEPSHGESGPLRVVFLGRLTELKGADIVLRALQQCTAPISFDIYGPHEDRAYVETCKELSRTLSENITVRLHDGIDHGLVQQTLNCYDVFAYPTAGENFGHVIAEALSSSCIVVTTPDTPWTGVLLDGGGIVVPDRSPESWRAAINALAQLTPDERLGRRHRSADSYNKWAARPPKPHLWRLALRAIGSQ